MSKRQHRRRDFRPPTACRDGCSSPARWAVGGPVPEPGAVHVMVFTTCDEHLAECIEAMTSLPIRPEVAPISMLAEIKAICTEFVEEVTRAS